MQVCRGRRGRPRYCGSRYAAEHEGLLESPRAEHRRDADATVDVTVLGVDCMISEPMGTTRMFRSDRCGLR
jgi:hypothetical protein